MQNCTNILDCVWKLNIWQKSPIISRSKNKHWVSSNIHPSTHLLCVSGYHINRHHHRYSFVSGNYLTSRSLLFHFQTFVFLSSIKWQISQELLLRLTCFWASASRNIRMWSDTTERLHFHFSRACIGEGNGNPLQGSCLENPRDGGAWWAAVSGVTQSRTDWCDLAAAEAAVSSMCAWALSHFSHAQIFVTLWTVTHQAPLSMGFSRQEYWSGLPCPPLGELPDPGIEPMSLNISSIGRWVLYH